MSMRAAALLGLVAVCTPAPPQQRTSVHGEPKAVTLETWSWLDAPGRVLGNGGVQLVAVGGDLLREHEGALLHDGRVTRVPGCDADDLRDIVDVGGTFPDRAVMLRNGPRLYHWQGDEWRALPTALPADTLLATSRRDAVLVSSEQRGYTIAAALPTRARMPVPTRAQAGQCTTVLARPHGARGNARGDLVVWGEDCDGTAVIEWFPADDGAPRLTRWPDAVVGAVDLGPTGRLLATRSANDKSEILVANDAGWRPLTERSGSVDALLDAREAGLFAIVGTQLEVWQGDRWRRVAVDDARTLARASDGSLWIGTSTALLRTRAPAFEWTLDPHGCDVATVANAAPYLLRGKRPMRWHCDGGAFARTTDVASWRAAWPDLAGEIELGFAAARRRRGKGDTPLAPGTPIEPVVARELDALHFGFALHGDDELVELAWTELAARLSARGEAIPTLLCAAPIGLPEAEVRRRATRTTSE
jgi:hypothetical protein